MNKETPIINIMTYGLPRPLAKQIYNEYEQRSREVDYILDISKKYEELREFRETVQLMLALSIFHKRVLTNLDAAVKFFGTVNRKSGAEVIALGNFNLDIEQKKKLEGAIISFKKLIGMYGIPNSMFDYSETKEFLLKVMEFKNSTDGKQNK